MSEMSALISLLIQHNTGNPEKVNHILKVCSFARAIAIEEGLSDSTVLTIEVAAAVCDIAETGNESALVSDMLLLNLGYERSFIEKVHDLVLKNANYDEISGIDYQILAEANFIVSAHEKRLDKESIIEVMNSVFKTKCGKQYLCDIFAISRRGSDR